MIELEGYFDESGTHDQSDFMYVAGCVLEKESWKIVEKGWLGVLKHVGIESFHASECDASKGQFAGWSDQQKQDVREKLVELIIKHEGVIVCQGIRKSEYNKISLDFPFTLVNPYEYCMIQCVKACIGGMNELAKKDDRYVQAIFFEEGQNIHNHIRKYMHSISKSKIRITEIGYKQKKESTLFQISDLIAYETWKNRTNKSKHPRDTFMKLRNSKIKIRDLFSDKSQIRQFFQSAHNVTFNE